MLRLRLAVSMTRSADPLGEKAQKLFGASEDGVCFALVPKGLSNRLNAFRIDC
jgi:hypothetical protein